MTSPDPFASQPPAGPQEGATPASPPGSSIPPSTTVAPAAPPLPATAHPPQAGIVVGIILVLIGAVFLVVRLVDVTLGAESWPLWIIVPGLAMFVAAFALPRRGGLGLAIPGAMIAIVGVILWVQQVYGLYATWAYAWALVAPTGPGLATLAFGIVKGDRGMAGDGLRMTLVGLGLFLGFALFFEGVVGLSGERIAGLDDILPFVVIGLGALLVVLSVFGRRERQPRT
jgi:hypothetical protein